MDPETKMVKDYYDIKQAVQPIVDRLDHQHLGYGEVLVMDEVDRAITTYLITTVKGMSIDFLPTSENLLVWIASQLDPKLPWCRLRLNETCTSSAILERWEYERYHTEKGGKDNGQKAEGHEEGSEKGQEVPTEGKEKAVASPFITDDDLPF
jgi:6-pyruvoyl-tetrahydropterin synthase